MQDYYVSRLRAIQTAKNATIAGLTTQGEAQTYQTSVRNTINGLMFGNLPAHAVLSSSTEATLTRTGYTVEKVLIETAISGWLISANLYVPDAAAVTPAPGILVLCGHATEGKRFSDYETYAQGLAKLGYVVLIIDPIGEGERLMVPTSSVSEHRLVGQQMQLLGLSMVGLQTWDALCALDYLMGRSEVDTTHIGVTGNSGGGTQTTWIGAMDAILDQRVNMLVPSCFPNTFLANLENELWADNEQVPLDAMGAGIDIDDFLLAYGGDVLQLARRLDYFDLRGVTEISDRVDAYYTLLASPTHTLYVDEGDHGLGPNGRAQAYAFFDTVSGSGFGSTEPSISLESGMTLNVTATGSVLDEAGAIDSVGLLTAFADDAATARGTPTGATLDFRIRDVLRLPDYDAGQPDLIDTSVRAVVPYFRIWEVPAGWSRDGTGASPAIVTPPNYPKTYATRYGVETEAGIICPVYYLQSTQNWHSQPPTVTAGTAAILYVSHLSADQDLSTNKREGLVTSLIAANPTTAFFAMDVRGAGESQPNTNAANSASISSTPADNFWAELSDSLSEPLLGRKVWDVLRVIDFLASFGYTSIRLAGRGWGAIPAALAAFLDSRVTAVQLKNSLTRWHACAIAKPDQMSWPQSLLPAKALLNFDLPDVYADLATNKGLSSAFNATHGQTEYGDTPWGAWLGNAAGEF